MKYNIKSLLAVSVLLAVGCYTAQADQLPYYGDVNYGGSYPGSSVYDADTDTYTINGCGVDVWMQSDQFHFVYLKQDLDTDFDYMVKLESFGGNFDQAWMKAGLMAREGSSIENNWDEESNVIGYELYGDSRAYFTMGYRTDKYNAVGGFSTYHTSWRSAQAGNVTDATSIDSGLAYNYPDYLRIRRGGNTYYSYASEDGVAWTLLGSQDTTDWAAGPLGSVAACSENEYSLYVGMWVTSHDPNNNGAVGVFSGFQETPVNAPAFTSALPETLTILEGKTLALSATVSGTDPFTYTWKKDGAEIDSGTQASSTFTYSQGVALVEYSGVYTLTISNSEGEVSSTSTVTVNTSSDVPSIVSSGYNPKTQVTYVRFNKAMDESTITDTANYTLTTADGTVVTINSITASEGNMYVALDTAALTVGGDYILKIGSGLKDATGTAMEAPADKAFSVLSTTGLKTVVYLNEVDGLAYGKWAATSGDAECPSQFRDAIWNGTAGDIWATTTLSSLEYDKNSYNHFCAYISGYIIPPETGNYRFGVCSDDQIMFYMNTTPYSTDRSTLQLMGESCDFSNSHQYGTWNADKQNSDLVYLTKGEFYYFEVFFFEEEGGETFSVAWSLPSEGPLDRIADGTLGIGSDYVTGLYNVANTTLEFTTEPEDMTVCEHESFTLPVEINYASDLDIAPAYQWYFKLSDTWGGSDTWVAIDPTSMSNASGETSDTLSVAFADSYKNDGTYRLDASLGGKTFSSREIVVTIDNDMIAPTATVCGHNEMNKVIVTFSEPCYGYEDESIYSIDGLTISNCEAISYDSGVYGVVLTTDQQTEGQAYTLSIAGDSIYDDSNNYVPATKITFHAFVWAPGLAYLECFKKTSTYDTLFETVAWDIADGYLVNPQVNNYVEIYIGTFNKDNCVERITGYIQPAETGTYQFRGSCDDDYKMWIGEADAPASELTENCVSWEQGWCPNGQRVYDFKTGNVDAVVGATDVTLEAGKKYFYAVALREGGGGDYVTMTWYNTAGTLQSNGTAPILTGDLIGIYANPDTVSITISQQPVAATVTAGDDVTFSVEATTVNDYNKAISYQWYLGGAAIEGATGASVTFSTMPADNGKEVYCALSAPALTLNSETAILTVDERTTPVTPIFVTGNADKVYVAFDSQPDEESAETIANYALDEGTISEATLGTFGDYYSVALTVSGCTESLVSVTVSNVENISGVPMPEAVTVTGGYSRLAVADLGTTSLPGYVMVYPGSMNFTASGEDIWNKADSCSFLYEAYEGDFDAVVCINDLEGIDIWSKVGLQFRQTLSADSPVVSLVAVPENSSVNLIQAATRPNPGAVLTLEQWPRINSDGTGFDLANTSVNGDVTYSSWLRLKRVGDTFYAYRSQDGEKWMLINYGNFTTVGEDATYAMPSAGYLGICLTSHSNGKYATAEVTGYQTNYVEPTPVSDPSDYTGMILGTQDVPAGFFTYNASTGVYDITGCSPDFWGTSDNCYFVYQEAPEGDFVYTAKINEFIAYTSPWAKAGLMIRETDADGNFTDNARYVITHTQRHAQDGKATPGNYNCRSAWRPVIGTQITDTYTTTCTETAAWPHWQRIARVGDVIKGYYSVDGETWVEFLSEDTGDAEDRTDEKGNVTTLGWHDGPIGSTLPMYIGMWVNANSSSSNAAYAQFSNVTLTEGPLPTDMELGWAIDGDNLVLSWAASYGVTAVGTAATIDAEEWTLIQGELVDGAYKLTIPMSTVSNGAFYRLAQ